MFTGRMRLAFVVTQHLADQECFEIDSVVNRQSSSGLRLQKVGLKVVERWTTCWCLWSQNHSIIFYKVVVEVFMYGFKCDCVLSRYMSEHAVEQRRICRTTLVPLQLKGLASLDHMALWEILGIWPPQR
jgi:hypothetical protein